MSIEQAAVEAMLDDIHPDLPTTHDKNSYTLGRMSKHNVVIAMMPRVGNNSAASVANQLKYPKMKAGGYVYEGVGNDRLFQAQCQHATGALDCEECDPAAIVERGDRLDWDPVVHDGTIGSSDVVVKDGQLRDKLRDDLKIYCVEMEGAGLMDTSPCLIIRGICNYADSHKNNR
ncbi:hypothetical protein BO71DRAFT_431076 [Aspergillus ellipticus CBS 707.79]|uniref:Purine and uridine phosphorylase n=1 Tax=Aspergillus ellipticus CBS 707.79 TaxID=1448320 RepID=A0A319D795_9EURO|nr:hypothetical protein BO71DRAFT_431076 [Aspergillus ellipticus CBS 707.79]